MTDRLGEQMKPSDSGSDPPGGACPGEPTTEDRPDELQSLTRNFRTKVAVCGCGCWLFLHTDRYGYGQFKFRSKNLIAHRFAYKRLTGDIPDDMTVDHLCDRHRNCVNPAHMELVSRTENSVRANARRKAQGKY